MHVPRGRRAAILAACLSIVVLAVPATVAAHAELVSSSPEAGSTVETSPETVTATFSEALESGKSSIEVVVPGGDIIATGGLVTDDPTTLSVAVPTLAPGTYRVRWTAASDDGHLERGRFDFTVAEAPSLEPTPAATAPPTTTPTSGAPVPPVASVSPSPSPSPSPATSAAPDASAGGSESTGQLLVIALAGIAVGVGIGWWRSRRPA